MNELSTVRLELLQGSAATLTLESDELDWTGATFALSLRPGGTELAGSDAAAALAIPAGGAAPGGSTVSLESATTPARAHLIFRAADTALIPAAANYSGELLIHQPGKDPEPLFRLAATCKRGNTRA